MANRVKEQFFSVEDVLVHTMQFLSPIDLLSTSTINSTFHSASRKDVLWRHHCVHEFSVPTLTHTPPDHNSSIAIRSFFEMFQIWGRSFYGYRHADVKAIYNWWTQFELWCKENAPAILDTLNGPASETDFVEASESFDEGQCSTIPMLLRLLYRFHNGQRQLFHRNNAVTQENIRRRFLGIFGGTAFYDSEVCMRLLPLKEVVKFTKMMRAYMGDSASSHPPCSIYDISHRSSYDESSFPSTSIEDCMIFSTSIVRMDKFYCVGPEQLSCVPQHKGTVYVVNDDGELTPCHPVQPKIHLPSENCGTIGKDFMHWLNEYIRRLQEGIYQFQPIYIDAGTYENPLIPYMISHYPLKPLFDLSDVDEVHNIGATRCVTRNIEVTASPAFIPEKSNASENSIFWSYSIRFRTLSAPDPDFVPAFSNNVSTCQLTTRHWTIYEPVDAQHATTNTVNGEGVIGLHPLLKFSKNCNGTDKSRYQFAYQSCSTATKYPGKFSGFMKFVPGSKDMPSGEEFYVHVAEFKLTIPEFIF